MKIVLVLGALVMLSILVGAPISCHQSIVRKQAIMAKAEIHMSYWDIFWAKPEIRYNQGKVIIVND